MKRVLLSITLILGGLRPLYGLGDREAMVQLLARRGALRTVATDEVEFAVTPTCSSADWSIRRLHFDPALHVWTVEVGCRAGGVPVLAIVKIDDERLFRSATPAKSPIVVRAGERKQLVADLAGVRITEPVVCLGSGRRGDVIRVRSLDGRIVRRVNVTENGSLLLGSVQ